MSVLQIGVAKSGNSWLWKLIEQVHRQAGLPDRKFIHTHPIYPLAKRFESTLPGHPDIDLMVMRKEAMPFFWVSPGYWEVIEDPAAYVRASDHVWTHAPALDRWRHLFDLFEKKVYILRDVRDVLVSSSEYQFLPLNRKYRELEERTPAEFLRRHHRAQARAWVKHLAGHLLKAGEWGVHVVRYEDLLSDFDHELDRLLAYLGIDLPEASRQAVKQAVSFGTMKASAPGHLRQGTSGGWARAMPADVESEVWGLTAPMMKLAGYARTAGQRGRPDPSAWTPARIHAAVNKARSRTFRELWEIGRRSVDPRRLWRSSELDMV